MFTYFELEVIEEIRHAKSKISITFNRQGLKCKKISVVSVVIHFINEKYEAILRLISLPKLLEYRKTGVSMLFLFIISVIGVS